jgi:hypothetical protein
LKINEIIICPKFDFEPIQVRNFSPDRYGVFLWEFGYRKGYCQKKELECLNEKEELENTLQLIVISF